MAASCYTSQEVERMKPAFVMKLRSLVDKWFDSAVYPDGSELPMDRSLTGPLLKFLPHRKIYRPEPDCLHNILLDWAARVGASVGIDAAGRYDVRVPDPRPAQLRSNGFMRCPIEEYAQDRAIFYFKQLLELPDAHRAARCSNTPCRRYYARARLRKRLIIRGAFCGKCIGVSSRKRMKISREVKKKKLVEVAANYWGKWPSNNRRGGGVSAANNEWVGRAITKELKLNLLEKKTGKWVARNHTAIEMEVERRTNAKS
ncbi:MAG: hypothetical protein EXQ58_02320 [Acidobacteria bacterium]|nr:hypothetical protein [Acidobacteriota bacterium]